LLQSATFIAQPIPTDTAAVEEILVTANRVSTSIMLSPEMVQVFSLRSIRLLNGTKLSDALETADAVFIRDYGFRSGLKTISLNSSQSEHALVLLNGVKLNSPQNSQYDAGLLDLDDISRIEILKGGSSALYGTEAIGGVINIISGSSITKPFSFSVSNEIGSYGLEKLFLKTMNRLKTGMQSRADIILSYSNESARNDYTYNYFNGFSYVLRHRDNSDYRARTFNADVDYRINNKSSLRLFTLYDYHNRGIAGVDIGYSSSSSRQIDRNLISSASYKRNITKTLELNSNFDYKYSLMNYYDPQTFSLPQPLNDFYKLNSFINSSVVKYINKQIEINTGYELSYNSITSNETEAGSLLQGGIFSAGKIEFDNPSISKITVYPSVRYDYYSDIHKNVFSGKFGLNLKPLNQINLTIKSSIGSNFRAPTFNELYWIGLGNKNLLPERSFSFDPGSYFGFHILTDNVIEISYFNSSTTDRIVWTPDQTGTWRPINIGKVNAEGIDASLRTSFNINQRFSAEVSFNYNLANAIKKNMDFPGDLTYNKQLAYLPQDYAKSSLKLEYHPGKGFLKLIALNLFYTFTGKRFEDLDNIKYVPYYELIDGNINVTFNVVKTETSVKFSVNNLTDQDYLVISGYPMPLRNYKLQLSINY
jgi:outer membrane cobalamin receptor